VIVQGSPEWLAMRAGKITASRIADVMAKGKGGAESAMRAKYRAQTVAERLTGLPQEEGYESDAMRRGTEKEPFARMAYEAERGVLVDQVYFVAHPEFPRFGCSPDGLVGDDGGIEIKCPYMATHIRWVVAGEVPPEHIKQMMWSMAVTGREWWDFVSFDDRAPDDLRLFVRRLERDEKAIEEMLSAAKAFDVECEEMLAKLRETAA
jgi:putative phage-type endonuclease